MTLSAMLRLFERAPEPAHLDVAHCGEVYRIAVKRSAQSRRFTLRIRAASRDALLTMPERASMRAAREFAERHSAWIGARLARLPRPVAFEPGEVLPLRGVDHAIVHRVGRAGRRLDRPGSERPADLRRGRASACLPQGRRLPEARGAEGHRNGGRPLCADDRRQAEKPRGARHGEPLGLVFLGRAPELLLASHPRAALRARLSGRARGHPYGAPQPFREILDARSAASARRRTARKAG